MKSRMRMREQITFLHPVMAKNAIGEDTIEYQPWHTVWAEAKPVRGVELIQAQKTDMTVSVVSFTCRYIPVTTAMRLIWRGQEYEINTPPVLDPSQRYLVFQAIGRSQTEATSQLEDYAAEITSEVITHE